MTVLCENSTRCRRVFPIHDHTRWLVDAMAQVQPQTRVGYSKQATH